MRERRQRRHRLFLLQNRASLSARLDCSSLIRFFANCPNFALFGSVGVLGRSCSQIATQGILVAYTGIFTAEKKKAYIILYSLSFLRQNVLTTSLILFVFLTGLSITNSIFLSASKTPTRLFWKVGIPE